MGDHAEMVRIDFDPTEISYETLVRIFWSEHNPQTSSDSQYRAELLCADDEQLELAQRSKHEREAQLGAPVLTRISHAMPFYPAEDYHQKWRLRRQPLLFHALTQIYDDEASLLRSTAATKLNAHVVGQWVEDGFEFDAFGLPQPLPSPLPDFLAGLRRPPDNP